MTLIKKITKVSSQCVLGLLALGLSGCIISVNESRDSTNRISEDRDVAAFTKIVVDGRVHLDIVVGKTQDITVMGRDKAVYATSTSVNNGVLRISVHSINGSRPRVRVAVPSLDALNFDARVDARVTGLDAQNFTLNIEGSGDIYLSGTCGSSSIEVDGNADVYAERFKCETVNIEMDGNGDVTVFARNEVTVNIDGHSDITVYGGGRVNTSQISGGGSVRVR
jgi:hypothetical protein